MNSGLHKLASRYHTLIKSAAINSSGQYCNSLLEDMSVRIAMGAIVPMYMVSSGNTLKDMENIYTANREWNYLSTFLVQGGGRFVHFGALVCRREMRHYHGPNSAKIIGSNRSAADEEYQATGEIGALHNAAEAYEKQQLTIPNAAGTFRGTAYKKFIPFFRRCYELFSDQSHFTHGYGGPMWGNFAGICGQICELLGEWEKATLEGREPEQQTQSIGVGKPSPKWQHVVPEGYELPQEFKPKAKGLAEGDVFSGFASKTHLIAREISSMLNIADGMCHNNSSHLDKMIKAEGKERRKFRPPSFDPMSKLPYRGDSSGGFVSLQKTFEPTYPSIERLNTDQQIEVARVLLNTKELQYLADQFYVILPILKSMPDLFGHQFAKLLPAWYTRAAFYNKRVEEESKQTGVEAQLIPLKADINRIRDSFRIIDHEKRAIFQFTKEYAKKAPGVREKINAANSIESLDKADSALKKFAESLYSYVGRREVSATTPQGRDHFGVENKVRQLIIQEAARYPGSDIRVVGPVRMFLSVTPEGKVVEGEQQIQEQRILDPYEYYEEQEAPVPVTVSSESIWNQIITECKIGMIGQLAALENLKMDAKQRARVQAEMEH